VQTFNVPFRHENRQLNSNVDKSTERVTKGKNEFDARKADETNATGFFQSGHIGGKTTSGLSNICILFQAYCLRLYYHAFHIYDWFRQTHRHFLFLVYENYNSLLINVFKEINKNKCDKTTETLK